MSRKGEANQMFQMLMTLIVVGMIMLLGFQLISNLFSRSEEIDYINFRRSLVNEIDAVASSHNARQRIELNVPSGSNALCFIDVNHEGNLAEYPLVNAYWRDRSYREQDDDSLVRNAFLIGGDFFLSFTIDNLEIDRSGRYICIPPRRNNVEFWAIGGRTGVHIEGVE